jgi:ATP-dependent protease Clp ATPase subunit
VDGPALHAVAELAAQQGTGARGLLTVRLPLVLTFVRHCFERAKEKIK